MAGQNPVRTCMICQQEDDHPRCHHQLADGRWVEYHFDCCAATGCEHAKKQIKGLPKGATGDDMRAHLTRDWKD